MKDENKTKEQLINELVELTRSAAGLEESAAWARRIEKQMRRAYSEPELRLQEKTIELERTNGTLQTDIIECRQIEKVPRQLEERDHAFSGLISDYVYIFCMGPEGKPALEWTGGPFTYICVCTIEEIKGDPGQFMAVIKSIVNFQSAVVKLPSGD